MDLNNAYSAVRDLPDSALQQEMQQPSGLLPQYMIMGELADRASIRGGMGNPKPPTIKDQIMQRLGPAPQTPGQSPYTGPSMAPTQGGGPAIPGYSRGGMIAQINPFVAQQKAMGNPQMQAGLQQDATNNANGGMMPLQQPQSPGAPAPAPMLSTMTPLAPGNPADIDSGGLATLLRSR